jgi:fibronectin-binding autotransporter adhesin
MNNIYRLVWSAARAMRVPTSELARSGGKGARRTTTVLAAGLLAAALLAQPAGAATTFLDISAGLPGWTIAGDVTETNTTSAFTIGGSPFSLTPATGYDMARIAANGGPSGVDATLGLSANALENFLNNGNGSITNFGLLTQSTTFAVGTYSFSWAYAAEDYQPYNDGAVFSLVGGGSESLISLARNGSDPTDLSGPSPGTLILGSYGSTAWMSTSFTISTAGSYQIGFAAYNWNDTALSPNLFISAVEGSFTGTPVDTSGGTPPPDVLVIGGTGGDVSASVFGTGSAAYAQATLAFDGGTLQYTADTATNKDATLTAAGGIIDTNGNAVGLTGGISGAGDFTKTGVGVLTLTGNSSYTGATHVEGGTLALAGTGSIAASSGVIDNGAFDIAGTTAGASIQDLAGSGTVQLGSQRLVITAAAGTFAGTISGSGGLTLGGGQLALSGSHDYTGSTQIDAGTLALAGTGSIAASSGVIDDGTFDISGTSAGASVRNLGGSGLVLLGSQTLTITNAAGTFAGDVGGSGALVLGGGTLSLDGASSYSGGTQVLAGAVLQVGSNAALGNAAGGLSLGGGTLQTTATISMARALALTGIGTINTAVQTTLSESAAVSGTGQLVKAGAGTLVLSGDNSNWGSAANTALGGLVVDAGSVVIAGANSLGNGAVVLNAGTLQATTDLSLAMPLAVGGGVGIDVATGTRTSFAGPVSGTTGASGCLQKTGAGALVFSGTYTVAAGTCVQQGSLYANGQFNSSLDVASGALLRGLGTITAPVQVSGTLAPGNSPGTLTTTATVTMNGGSSFQVDINGLGTGSGPGNYSRLLVTGANSQFVASGATLIPNLVNITGAQAYTPWVPLLGSTFRIVTADGGVVGRFTSVVQPIGLAAGTRMQAFYDFNGNHSIDLVVTPTSYAAYVAGQGANGNAASAGGALDVMMVHQGAGTASTTEQQLLYFVGGQDGAAVPGLVTQLAGEIHTALAAAAPQAQRWLVDSVGTQLDNGVGGRRNVWSDLGSSDGTWHSDAVSSGFRVKGTQLAVGFDLLAPSHGRAGLGFIHGKSSVTGSYGNGEVREAGAFLYGRYELGAFVLDGVASLGSSHWESHRADPLGGAALATDRSGTSTALAATLGWPVSVGALHLNPYARASWERVTRQSFDEGAGSAASLQAGSYAAGGARIAAGVQLNSLARDPLAARFTYQVDVGGGLDDSAMTQPALVATMAGSDFTLRAPQAGRGFFKGQVSGTARLGDRWFGHGSVASEVRAGKAADLAAHLGVTLVL